MSRQPKVSHIENRHFNEYFPETLYPSPVSFTYRLIRQVLHSAVQVSGLPQQSRDVLGRAQLEIGTFLLLLLLLLPLSLLLLLLLLLLINNDDLLLRMDGFAEGVSCGASARLDRAQRCKKKTSEIQIG